jgi:3-oxo-5-alpha-steroid 4-dehydrogenase 3
MLTLTLWATRVFYLLSSVAILTVRLTPAFAERFLAYGARVNPAQDGKNHNEKLAKQNEPSSVGIKLLDYLATFTVPHSWFLHFYILSLSCSVTALSTFYYFDYYYEDTIKQNPNIEIAAFCAHMMLLQGLRRLLECVFVTRNSTSRMWIGHYAIGMAFYLVTNVAIWIEQLNFTLARPTAEKRSILWTWRTMFCTLIFFAASNKQNTYHRYLASLEKYTLPDKYAFRYIIAPHYTMECVIYLAMAMLDAPVSFNGQEPFPELLNWTLICALVFVAVNLGVTADATKEWQRKKFRDESFETRQRRRMIPWIY